jgi:hypothetical protein
MRSLLTAAVSAVILLVGGCSVPLREAHPDWPEKIHQAIERGELVPGMTYEQAELVVGRPRSWQDRSDGLSIGIYALAIQDYGVVSESATLLFRQGKLVQWSFQNW